MTEQELRELDAWIAEHVMGYKWFLFHHDESLTRQPYFLLSQPSTWQVRHGGTLVEQGPKPTEEKDLGSVYKYTTDPAYAMEVLKKCAEKWIVTVELGKDGSGQSYAWVARLNLGTEDNFKCAPTLELAICLFAKQLFAKTT
jgi:hypothetical protein